MNVSALASSDAARYRELMLEAYEQAPDAFTSTAGERSAEPLSWWSRRIAHPDGLTEAFGAFDGQVLAGSVAVEYSSKPKTRHSALLIGMYVKASRRGAGTGSRLLEAAVSSARKRPELRWLRLTVTEGNERAIGLYRSAGFAAWGVEPEAILTAGGYRGKVHMAMALRGPSSTPGFAAAAVAEQEPAP